MKRIESLRFIFSRECPPNVYLWGVGGDFNGYLYEFRYFSTLYENDFLGKIKRVFDGSEEKYGNCINIGTTKYQISSLDDLINVDREEKKNSILIITTTRPAGQIERMLNEEGLLDELLYAKAYDLVTGEDANLIMSKTKLNMNAVVFRQLMKSWAKIKTDQEIEDDLSELTKVTEKGFCIIPEIGVKVTQKCTLRCKNCIDHIPHMEPKDVPLDVVLRDIDLLVENAAYIGVLYLVSGEVLLYPHLEEVLTKILSCKNIHRIEINTNGMAVPSEKVVPCLQNPKIHIGMSDYGDIVRMAKAIDFYERRKIGFSIAPEMTKWNDVGKMPQRRFLQKEELIDEFQSCSVGTSCCPELADGRLYRCGITEKFYEMGVYSGQRDYVDVKGCAGKEFRDRFNQIMSIKYLESCDMCDVSVDGNNKSYVTPGIQIEGNHQIYRSGFTFKMRNDDNN